MLMRALRLRLSVGIALLTCLAAACGTVQPGTGVSPASGTASPCDDTGHNFAASVGRVDRVVARYRTNAAGVAAWQQTRGGASEPRGSNPRWTRLPASERVDVCIYDGDFSRIPKRAPNGQPIPAERLIIEIDASGEVVLDAFGPRTGLEYPAPVQVPGS